MAWRVFASGVCCVDGLLVQIIHYFYELGAILIKQPQLVHAIRHLVILRRHLPIKYLLIQVLGEGVSSSEHLPILTVRE